MNTIKNSVKVNGSLFVNVFKNKDEEVVEVAPAGVNHIVAIDCSGSMSYDLPRIREQLKKKLPKVLNGKSTISIIWFSGRGQCGVLLEAEPVHTLSDLASVNSAIDRWLSPVGLTGFLSPIKEAVSLAKKVGANGLPCSLFFMTDGCDNQHSREELVKESKTLSSAFATVAFVEYGYYADRRLLTEFAEASSGSLLFSQDFDKYDPLFEMALSKSGLSSKKKTFEVGADGLYFGVGDSDVYSMVAEDGKVTFPADTKYAFGVSTVEQNSVDFLDENLEVVYHALAAYGSRMQPKVVYSFLELIGDVALFNVFSGCFGKEKYAEFVEACSKAAKDPAERFKEGRDTSAIPNENAFTVLELLKLLSNSKAKVDIDGPDFKYSRIGRKAVDSNTVVTHTEKKRIAELTELMGTTKDPSAIASMAKEIADLMSKPEPLVFIQEEKKDGYGVNSLVFNETSPNVSINIKRNGTVDISKRAPKEVIDEVGSIIQTHQYRSYTIIKDGLVNVEVLPCLFDTQEEFDFFIKTLSSMGVSPDQYSIPLVRGLAPKFSGGPLRLNLNLKRFPVINRAMTKGFSARKTFNTEWLSLESSVLRKMVTSLIKELTPAKSEADAKSTNSWLIENGFKPYGFNPKVTLAEPTDFYVVKDFSVSMKGFSTIPSLKDVRTRIASGKHTPSSLLASKKLQAVEHSLESVELSERLAFLEAFAEKIDEERKAFLYEAAQRSFIIILGQVWFDEFSSLDENSMEMEFTSMEGDSYKVLCTAELKEVEIKI